MKKNNKYKIILFIILLFASIIYFITNNYKYYIKETQTEKENVLLEKYEQKIESNSNNNDIKENTDTIEVVATPEKEINSYTTDWELILVNKNNKIPDNYSVNLSTIENNHKVDSRIAKSLKNMLKDARSEGLNPLICSSYRTRDTQIQLYNNKVRQYLNKGYSNDKAKELASYWVTIPGTSEHEIGLAVDIVSRSFQVLDERQEKTEIQKWLKENSYKYGFTLRYPTDKNNITMINYEPWHYRFVGVENAKYMKENDMCLEEYIDYLKYFEQNND